MWAAFEAGSLLAAFRNCVLALFFVVTLDLIVYRNLGLELTFDSLHVVGHGIRLLLIGAILGCASKRLILRNAK